MLHDAGPWESTRLGQEAEVGVRGKHDPELLSYFPQERQDRTKETA